MLKRARGHISFFVVRFYSPPSQPRKAPTGSRGEGVMPFDQPWRDYQRSAIMSPEPNGDGARRVRAIRWIALAGALLVLGGCVVVPAYPRYSYHYHPYRYY